MHRLTTSLANTYTLAVVEDVNVTGMAASAKGSGKWGVTPDSAGPSSESSPASCAASSSARAFDAALPCFRPTGGIHLPRGAPDVGK